MSDCDSVKQETEEQELVTSDIPARPVEDPASDAQMPAVNITTGRKPRCKKCKKHHQKCVFSARNTACKRCQKFNHTCEVGDVVIPRIYSARGLVPGPKSNQTNSASSATAQSDHLVHTTNFLQVMSDDDDEGLSSDDTEDDTPAVPLSHKRRRMGGDDPPPSDHRDHVELRQAIVRTEEECREILADQKAKFEQNLNAVKWDHAQEMKALKEKHGQEIKELKAKLDRAVDDLFESNKNHSASVKDLTELLRASQAKLLELLDK